MNLNISNKNKIFYDLYDNIKEFSDKNYKDMSEEDKIRFNNIVIGCMKHAQESETQENASNSPLLSSKITPIESLMNRDEEEAIRNYHQLSDDFLILTQEYQKRNTGGFKTSSLFSLASNAFSHLYTHQTDTDTRSSNRIESKKIHSLKEDSLIDKIENQALEVAKEHCDQLLNSLIQSADSHLCEKLTTFQKKMHPVLDTLSPTASENIVGTITRSLYNYAISRQLVQRDEELEGILKAQEIRKDAVEWSKKFLEQPLETVLASLESYFESTDQEPKSDVPLQTEGLNASGRTLTETLKKELLHTIKYENAKKADAYYREQTKEAREKVQQSIETYIEPSSQEVTANKVLSFFYETGRKMGIVEKNSLIEAHSESIKERKKGAKLLKEILDNPAKSFFKALDGEIEVYG